MFKYFILRTQQQLLCYFCGIVLAMVLMLLSPSVVRGSGFYLLLSSVALFWAGLALYTRRIDRMRKPEVSPLVSIRDGIQVVAEVPRHEKARLEWEILRDDEVFRQQRWELTGLTGRVISRGLLYMPAVMLVGMGILAWGSPQDAIRLINALRNMPAAELVHQIGFVLCLFLQISVISVLIADVVAGRGLPNVFRRALLDRLPAEFCLIRRGTER
ncbi:hypothetical protein QIH22_17490 [Klebsiella pneumoniae]|uniref:hypothetical protein n=1 Tax=Klebsiella pneumoniae TaxID=573 RepID=UPI0012967FDE|nr:hypothetical protein [Klebsiella pneumoniae]HDH1439627.1 hypothetical protein [Klebsiella quasipneumoniae subsp. similipneumoniae]MDH8372528.1 hypothetical protein [Klebsiella pneumoniae]MDH8590093.1 hypothetical protein [Klebsiella pneumoniae]QGA59004.1 hypothetical protein GHA50_00745 [Klebsiella pneumoniae]HBT5060007.1 hypothetical protein [Klebsiella pneumoniae]